MDDALRELRLATYEATRDEAESIASADLSVRLGPLISLAQELDELFRQLTRTVSEHPEPGPAAKVGLLLSIRIANDLRTCVLLGGSGYGMQALTMAASVFELSGAIAFVGSDPERAVRWAEHDDPRHSYPGRASEGFAAIASTFNLSDHEAEVISEGYTYACRAKHGNPRTVILHGLQFDGDGTLAFAFGPDALFLGSAASARGIWYAITLGTMAVRMASRHCSDPKKRSTIVERARRINERRLMLEQWYLSIITRTSNETDSDLEQAAQLASVTRELNRRTKELREATEALRNARPQASLSTESVDARETLDRVREGDSSHG